MLVSNIRVSLPEEDIIVSMVSSGDTPTCFEIIIFLSFIPRLSYLFVSTSFFPINPCTSGTSIENLAIPNEANVIVCDIPFEFVETVFPICSRLHPSSGFPSRKASSFTPMFVGPLAKIVNGSLTTRWDGYLKGVYCLTILGSIFTLVTCGGRWVSTTNDVIRPIVKFLM